MSSLFIDLLKHLANPSDLLLSLLAIGVFLCWIRGTKAHGLILCTVCAAFFLAIKFLPIAAWISEPLEDRFPNVHLPNRIDGLIVLGGAVDIAPTLAHGIPSLNADAERMTEFVRLAKAHPNAKLVFSGGAGSQDSPPTISEADVARQFFQEQGIALARVTFESRSQNTYENVLFSKALVRPRKNEVWVLISSAQDVPRCVGVFNALGWPIIPRAVAFKSAGSSGDEFSKNLSAVDRTSHEWMGLLYYRLSGKTKELFPRPT